MKNVFVLKGTKKSLDTCMVKVVLKKPKREKLYGIVIIILLIFCCFSIAEEIKLRTADGCILSAYEKIVSTSSPVLLEVHGLGSNKNEWNKFNTLLEKEKINYLALDLRGHGKSTSCATKTLDYKTFSSQDWQKIIFDWEAGVTRLLKKFPSHLIIPTGASIGANSAVIFSSNKKFRKIILLSPGYDYAGFKPQFELEKTGADIFFSYSISDHYSAKSCYYFSLICSERKLNCYFLKAQSGHGVQIFDLPQGADYAKEIIKFIKSSKIHTILDKSRIFQ